MRAFSKEIIEKIKSMPDDRREMLVDGLARLYAVRPHRASEDINKNSPLKEEIAVEVPPQNC